MLYRIIAILFASLTCNAVSGAECGKECSAVAAAPNAALEDVLVTGTFAPQPALTSSVSVLDAQQIQALNKTTVADLLRTLPGLLVEQQGGPGTNREPKQQHDDTIAATLLDHYYTFVIILVTTGH